MWFRKNKNMWRTDESKKFRINAQKVAEYFDKKQTLVFTDDSARLEEEAILPFINITDESKVLDLGCGNGRWGKIFINKCKKYVGVDISKKFINEMSQKYKDNQKVKLFHMPAQEYISEEKYDLILIIGLITYMNDNEIMRLSRNCRRMLNKNGRVILRNVTLGEGSPSRMSYNYRPNFIKRLLGSPGYQLIRRSVNEELKLFKDFKLVYMQQIEGTGYTFYILK